MCLYKYILIILFTIPFILSAQNNTKVIKGKVIDGNNGDPIVGANVFIQPSRIGTVTDKDGLFFIHIPSTDTATLTLVSTFIGMNSCFTPLDTTSFYLLKMTSNINELSQIVITSSYGTKKFKEDIVGSISSIKSKDIQVDQAYESIDKMLDGQIAGVSMESGDSPLEPVSIDIRGQGTLSSINNTNLSTSSQPLVIIDGVIMTEETGVNNSFFDGTGTYSEDMLNPLAQIAPEDIESVSVLKDAAAVGIYGADGANGVIIITTKHGRHSKMKVNFSTQQGVSKAINRIEYMNGEEYTQLRNEYLKNTGQDQITYNGIDTDWFGLLNRNGYFQKYAMDFSGGGNLITYRVGANYLNYQEAQEGNYSNQYRLSSNISIKLKKFKWNLTLNPSLISKVNPNIYYSYAFVPNVSAYNEDGSYGEVGVTGMANPLAAIAQNRNETNTYGLIGNTQFTYEINFNWHLNTSFGVDYKDKKQDRYFSGANESGQFNGTFVLDDVTYNKWGKRVINKRNSYAWTWKSFVDWMQTFNWIHNFNALLGMELYSKNEDLDYASGTGYVNPDVVNAVEDALRDDDEDTPTTDESTSNQTYSSDINNSSRVSLFGQFNYDFRKKYYFLLNLRRDESSVFGSETNVAFNGGAGLAWVISKENLFDDVRWIDFLKLRVSFGSTGNSRIGSYSSKGLYSISTSYTGYNGLNYATPDNDYPVNKKLGWEKNYKYDLGIDFNFLNRFNFTAEFYYDDIRDMISSRSVPTESGYNSTQINGTDMYNKGVEVALTAKLISKKSLKWNVNFNLATLKNEITSIKQFGDQYSEASLATAIKKGYSTSTIWGINWVGIDPATGRDMVEKDGEIYDGVTYNRLYSSSDWVPIGNTQAKLYGGFSSHLVFLTNWTFSFQGSYKWGNSKLISNSLISKYSNTSTRNLSVNALDYWTQPGDIATQPAVTSDNPTNANYRKFVYDASHLKIANVSLAYSIPVKKLNWFFKDLRVNANVSNVAIFYKEKSPVGKNGIKEFYYTYPQSRTWTFGLKAGF